MKKTKILFIMSVILVAGRSHAQFRDDFTDGDFTNNPTWSGDVARFAATAGKMKLQAPTASESTFLVVPSQAIHNGSWEFYLQMDFAPSSTNYAKIYLISDQPNLNQALNGYFIKAGNTSRDVSLYRQNGLVETRIVDGQDDRINQTSVKVKIKVTRSDAGVWQLFSDVGPTNSYVSEGSFTDNVNTVSSWFGVQCVYTATRSDKFWFDDFIVTGIPVPDVSPPTVLTVTTPNSQQVDLLFSEPLDGTSLQLVNFLLNKTVTPSAMTVDEDRRTLSLQFPRPLKNGETFLLGITNVKDDAGNTMPQTELSLLFFQSVASQYKDIIFTELLPDASPQVGLPNVEFAEIYNRSSVPFNVDGWELSDGSSTAVFPSQVILPGEYWIVTATSSVNLFKTFGKTIGLSNFPTLNNSSDSFILKNAGKVTIDSVYYNLDSYHDIDKQEGGWTLELIDPTNPCGEQDNWTSSDDPRGGTPGTQNSVFANKPDITPPVVTRVFAPSPKELSVMFNEKLDTRSLSLGNFLIDPPQTIHDVSFSDKTLRTVLLKLTTDLLPRKLYSLNVRSVSDCNKNEGGSSVMNFGLMEKPDSLDIVVNEILFNPRSGGVDFVEVYNPTDKFFNLKDLKIANYKDGDPLNVVSLFGDDVMMSPGTFVVVTTNPDLVNLQYPSSVSQNLYRTSLPSLADDEGSVVLLANGGKIIDQVNYTKKWHSVFIKDEEGVSLERISSHAASNDQGNWTSASATVGFATPGYANSQGRKEVEITEDNVLIEPEIFSPGSPNGGFVQIRYHFDTSPVANVRVFDLQGHLLRTIASNETLATEGFFRWDGNRDDGSQARIGYYIVWFEIFDNSGSTKVFHKRAVVSSQP